LSIPFLILCGVFTTEITERGGEEGERKKKSNRDMEAYGRVGISWPR